MGTQKREGCNMGVGGLGPPSIGTVISVKAIVGI